MPDSSSDVDHGTGTSPQQKQEVPEESRHSHGQVQTGHTSPPAVDHAVSAAGHSSLQNDDDVTSNTTPATTVPQATLKKRASFANVVQVVTVSNKSEPYNTT
jgi:hypothetical protein